MEIDTTLASDWMPLLERYLGFQQDSYGYVSPPASEADIEWLRVQARSLNLVVDDAIIALLRVTNGTGFDSVRFYGAKLARRDAKGRFDLIWMNRLIEERGDCTLLGEWQDEFFVHNPITGLFERQSKVTADAYDSYGSCAQMMAAILTDELEILDGAGEVVDGDG